MAENYLDQLKSLLHRGWQHVFDVLHLDYHQTLLEMLHDACLKEARDVAQFTWDAERMYYPQFHQRLLRIAAEEQAHAAWLRDTLLAIGGEIPAVSVTPRVANNAWEALHLGLEEEKRSCADLLEAMHIATQVDHEISEGLRRLREAERQHCEELLDMLVKSDPYTLGHAADEARHAERHGPAATWSKGLPAESGARVVG